MTEEENQRLIDFRELVASPGWARIKAELQRRLKQLEREILDSCPADELHELRERRAAIKCELEWPESQIALLESKLRR